MSKIELNVFTPKLSDYEKNELKKIDWTNDNEVINSVHEKGFWMVEAANKHASKSALSTIWDNKELVSFYARKDKNFLDWAIENVEDKHEVILHAFAYNPALEKLSKDLRGNKDFMTKAVQNYRGSLELISDELKNDEEFMLNAISWDSDNIEYASERLRGNKGFVSKAVGKFDIHSSLEHISEELRDDADIIKIAISRNTYLVKWASDRLKNDPEIYTLAIERQPNALEYFSDSLRNNKEIATEAIKSQEADDDYRVFAIIGDRLKGDKDFVLSILEYEPDVLKWVSPELKNDKELVFEVIKKCEVHYQYIGKELQDEIGEHNPVEYLESYFKAKELSERFNSTLPNLEQSQTPKKKLKL